MKNILQFSRNMREHSAAQRMERDKDLPQRSQSSAASLTSIHVDLSPSTSQFYEVNIYFLLIFLYFSVEYFGTLLQFRLKKQAIIYFLFNCF